MYLLYRENKDADQMRCYLEANLLLCFAYAKSRFSHDVAYIYFHSSLNYFIRGELIGNQSSWRPSVHLSVRPSTVSNMNISEASRPITIKFYLKQGERLHGVLR